jgi:hypothetical protein
MEKSERKSENLREVFIPSKASRAVGFSACRGDHKL